MLVGRLSLEILLIVIDFLPQKDLLFWIQSDNCTYAVLSRWVYKRMLALDKESDWPVSLVLAAAEDQIIMFRSILKLTKDEELGKSDIKPDTIPVELGWARFLRGGYRTASLKETSLLHILCQLGNERAIRLMLDTKSVCLSPHDSFGWTPILIAASNGYDSIVGLLCSRGVSVEERATGTFEPYMSPHSPLSRAIAARHLPTVKYLINAGAHVPTLPTEDCIDYLATATRHPNPSVMKYLLNTARFSRTSINRALFEALENAADEDGSLRTEDDDSVATIQLLVDAGARVVAPPRRGPFPFEKVRSAAAARVLLSKDPELAVGHQSAKITPLDSLYMKNPGRWGCWEWDPVPLSLLYLEKGITVKHITSRTNAFLMAAAYHHTAVVKAMLEKQGSLIDSRDRRGYSALHCAVERRGGPEQLHTVKALVEFGVDVHAVTKRGCTPLYMACMGGFSTLESVHVMVYLANVREKG